MKKKILVAALTACTIALGFLRDYIFVSINYFIEAGTDVEGRLLFLKWVLTLLFSVLYLLSTCAFLYILFNSEWHRSYIRLAVLSYLLLFVVALFSAAFGYFFTSFGSVYPFVRTVLGVAQSPIVTMILIPVCLLNTKAANKEG